MPSASLSVEKQALIVSYTRGTLAALGLSASCFRLLTQKLLLQEAPLKRRGLCVHLTLHTLSNRTLYI